jgi:hypothetical protein
VRIFSFSLNKHLCGLLPAFALHIRAAKFIEGMVMIAVRSVLENHYSPAWLNED